MVNDTIPLKQCSRKENCLHPDGAWLPATDEYFMPHHGKLYCQCHYCRREAKRQSHMRNREHNNQRTRRWIEANPTHFKEYYLKRIADPEYVEANRKRAREWHQADPERNRRRAREWYWADPERARLSKRNSHKRNPEAGRLGSRVRKIRVRSANGRIAPADVRLQLKSQQGKCWHCGKPVGDDYHVDHLIPLSRGGSNAPENIVISCPPCNLSKGSKTTAEWNGRLL